MKTVLKLISLFGFFLLMGSCASDKNSLTKVSVLEHLKKCEEKRPNIKIITIPSLKIKDKNEVENANTYYANLIKEDYLKVVLRTDIPNPETTNRPYEIVPTEKGKSHIIKKDNNGTVTFSMYETKAVAIKTIEILDDTKANVTVAYKKFKTPFYRSDYDVSPNQHKTMKPDTYTETLVFRKSHTNDWIYCE